MKKRSDIEDAFNGPSPFSSLSREEKSFLAEKGHVRFFARQENIFAEDQTAPGFYLLVSGLAKIFHLTSAGREIILHLVRPGGTMGESAVFQHGAYPASASAIEDSRAVFMPSDAVLRVIRQNPEFAVAMLTALSLRVRLLTRKIEAQGGREAPMRLAAYLAHRAQMGRNKKVVRLELSREDMAQMLGTARETLSRAMAALARRGIINVRGREVEILDHAALEETARG